MSMCRKARSSTAAWSDVRVTSEQGTQQYDSEAAGKEWLRVSRGTLVRAACWDPVTHTEESQVLP